MQYEIRERITLLVVTYVNADDLETAESTVMMQGAMEYEEFNKIQDQKNNQFQKRKALSQCKEIVSSREIGAP
jgi:hypothetical protein